jgi:hypothetical protein
MREGGGGRRIKEMMKIGGNPNLKASGKDTARNGRRRRKFPQSFG